MTKPIDANLDQILDLIKQGYTPTVIARNYKIPRSTLRDALERAARKGTTEAKEPVEEPEVPIEERLRAFLDERKLPPVPKYLKTKQAAEMDFRTPQPEIALFSDLHLGSEIDKRVTNGTAEYSIDIAIERLARWRDGVLRFLQLDGLALEIPSLHIFALGDDFEGHGDMFPTQKLQMGESIMFQYTLFVELMTDVILSFLERVPKVVIYKVPGNHGRVASTAKADYPPDNFELMAWENIADRVARRTGGEWHELNNGIRALTGGQVDFYISRSFFITALIAGKLIYARHGHRIGGLNRTYTGAIDNAFRMNAIIGRVCNYMFKGHLHEAQEAEPMISGQIIQSGCFVGPSLLSVEANRPSASIPSQEMYAIHPKYGLTHHHRIYLATADEIRQTEAIDFLSAQGVPLVHG